MKFTLSWLKDYLDTDASLQEIADTLTMVGLEVEEIDNPADKYAAFKVAYVESAEQHPDADRLQVCMVNTGDETVQVVCGAPNARTGMKGVFAPSGSIVPGTGMLLKKSKIRGVESNGMLVSEREMGLSDEHEGIIDLDDDAEIGKPFAELLGLDDPMIEIAITPNRPDCLGVYGIARDLAAAGLGKLKDIPIPPATGEYDMPVDVTLDLGDDTHLCPAFAVRHVRGVKNGPSPAWMQQRLRAIGLRPINALVDITNYVTYDRGRPLHVFDANKVAGNLVVRDANEGESLLALDGKEYTMAPGMVVIADDNGLESIGGIMGGEHTGCDENTTDVLIESALWDPVNVATTGRTLGVQSDARFRFERGVDPAFTVPGAELATNLVLDLCGGTPSELTVAGSVPEADKVIQLPISEVSRLLGLDVSRNEIKVILNSLGFWVAGTGEDGFFKVAIPSWRPDVHGKADLVEEVMRIVGVDKVPPVAMPRVNDVAKPILTLGQRRRRDSRRALAARGMTEAVTWSFVSETQAKAFGGGGSNLRLANPISSELSDMRPSVLPGLIAAAGRNADRGFGDAAIFEVGPAYHGDRPEDQSDDAAGIRRATAHMEGAGRHWSRPLRPVDLFDAKADALAALSAAGAPVDNLQIWESAPDWYHPGRSGTLQLGPKTVLAQFGEVHPRILELLDVEGPMVAFEVFLDNIPAPRGKPTRSRPPLNASDLQPVQRDFAFVVATDVKAGDVVRAAQGADKNLITSVSLFDLFEGKKAEDALGAGKKSLAIEVTLQPREKTLTDEEIDAIATRVVAQVQKATGGELRG